MWTKSGSCASYPFLLECARAYFGVEVAHGIHVVYTVGPGSFFKQMNKPLSKLILAYLSTFTGMDVLSSGNFELKGRQPDIEDSVSAKIQQGIQRLQTESERLKEANLWQPLTHDRRVELVFIGDESMQKDWIRAAVEAALLTPSELRMFLDSWETAKLHPEPHSETENPFANVPRCTINI